MDPFSLTAALDGGAFACLIGMVAWIGRMIGTGKWVPRSTHEDALRTIETQRKHIELQDARDENVILQVAETCEAILRTVKAARETTEETR